MQKKGIKLFLPSPILLDFQFLDQDCGFSKFVITKHLQIDLSLVYQKRVY